jgi:hypothetical protein
MAKKPDLPKLAVVRSEGEPRTHHFMHLRELSPEEYEKYAAAKKRVMRFVDNYLKFTMTRRSYAEYTSLLRAYDEKYSSERSLDELQAMAVTQEVNRRLRGFLAEMRSYIEHSKTALKDQYEEEAPEVVQSFLDECSQIFDSSASYRFVYNLRDYALHRSVVIQSMTYRTALNRETGEPQGTLSFDVVRDELLRISFNWKKHAEPYLKGLPERFRLDPHIDISMCMLEKINVAFVAAQLTKLKEAARYLNELVGSIQEPGSPCIIFDYPVGDPEAPNVQRAKRVAIDPIPTYAATGIENLPELDELRKLPGIEINFIRG